MKFTAPLFIHSCEINYVPRGEIVLIVAIKKSDKQWQLSIPTYLSTCECYVYSSIGKRIEGCPTHFHSHEYT